MAIKFATSSLSSTETNLYKIEKFNGVDYTTTPTQVDDSRAIEISNYLPEGDALVKRHGTKMVDTLIIKNSAGIQKQQTIFNIWKYGPVSEGDCYVLYVGEETTNKGYYSNFKLIYIHVPKNSELSFGNPQIITLKDANENDVPFTTSNVKLEDVYSYGIQYEKRLFLLLQDKYLMFYGDVKRNGGSLTYNFKLEEVKKEAYIPTVVSGLGPQEMYYFDDEINGDIYGDQIQYSSKVTSFEQINLLRNTVKIELNCVSPVKQNETGFASIYNIGKYLPKNIKIDEIGVTITKSDEVYTTLTETNNFTFYRGYDGDGEHIFLWRNIDLNHASSKVTTHYTFLHADDDYMFTYYLEGSYFNPNEAITLTLEISYSYTDGTNPAETVEKMRFGMLYGASGYNDKLFLTGNPNYPNVDIRTCNATYSDENWKDFSYFGDSEYHALGSSNSSIIDYGILNNGNMVIVKEKENGQPNLFFRTHEYSINTEGVVTERFPVVNSGVALEINKDSKLITYGNDLLVSTNEGLYKILAGSSTASQTYEVSEMSYFIRNNIDRSTSDNDLIVFKNKLYWSKRDIDGNNRIYVADKDRYGVVNGNQVYEWWALDGISPRKMFVFNNKLYFVNEKGLFTFSDDFTDSYDLRITDFQVGGDVFSKEVFIDNTNDNLIISNQSVIFTDIFQSFDVKKAYENFKKVTTISFDGNSFIETNAYDISVTNKESHYYDLKFKCSMTDYQLMINCILNCFGNSELKIYYNGCSYNFVMLNENIDFIEPEGLDAYAEFNIVIARSSQNGPITDTKMYFTGTGDKHIEYEIDELYTVINDVSYPLLQCVYEDNKVIYVGIDGKEYVELGNEKQVYFNYLKLKYNDLPVKFNVINTDSFPLSHVKIQLRNQINSFWKSKYTSFGREDYLKTAEMITFVAESRRGGRTNVGYRTLRKNTSFLTELIRKDFNFDYLDFESFSFGKGSFAQTHTAKKKIKNFSYMQIIMESNDRDDSTINSLSIKYKITKNNKGVR